MNAHDPVLADLARHLAERGEAEQEDLDRERFSYEDLAKLDAGEPPPEQEVDT